MRRERQAIEFVDHDLINFLPALRISTEVLYGIIELGAGELSRGEYGVDARAAPGAIAISRRFVWLRYLCCEQYLCVNFSKIRRLAQWIVRRSLAGGERCKEDETAHDSIHDDLRECYFDNVRFQRNLEIHAIRVKHAPFSRRQGELSLDF